MPMSARMARSPAVMSQPPPISRGPRRSRPATRRAMPSQGSSRLMLASSQAKTPGSCLRRDTLDDQDGSAGSGNLDPAPLGRIGAFRLPERIADAHLAAAVLDRLRHQQGTADVLLAACVEVG